MDEGRARSAGCEGCEGEDGGMCILTGVLIWLMSVLSQNLNQRVETFIVLE